MHHEPSPAPSADRACLGAAVLLLLLLRPFAASAQPASPGFTGAVQVYLHDAVYEHSFKTEQPDRLHRSSLVFEFEADNGKWARGLGRGLNVGDHFAFVQEAHVAPDSLRMKFAAIVESDPWISGGDAWYSIDLKPNAQGRFEGTWQGTYRGDKLDGKVTAQFLPPRPTRVKDFVPLAPGEHPRLMFRKHELPALKERLKTPLGQAFLAKAKGAAGHDPVSNAMLWQLTGDKSYADAAMRIVGAWDDLAPDHGAGTGAVGHRFVAVSHTLDLCWDAWPPSFIEKLTDQMLIDIPVIQRRLQIAGANFHPCSNFYGPARGSMAIGTLLFFDAKGPEPRKPAHPDEFLAKGDLRAMLLTKSGKADQYRAEYPQLLAKWQTQHDEWRSCGGADLTKYEFFLKGFHHMNRHYRVGIGDGGFAAETGSYAIIAARYPLFYAAYYLRCFGRNPSPFPDVTHLLSRRLMQSVFPPPAAPAKGRPRKGEQDVIYLKINSIGGFAGTSEWVAAAFPLIPDEHKPGILWAWNYVSNVDPANPASVVNILPDAGTYGTTLAHAFVNYPLDMKPVHPRDCMPLTWQASTMGLYLYRNGWEGPDDFVAQFFGKTHRIGGWNHPNAGTFNLWGLGHAWATCNPVRLGFRDQENVVLLPDDKIQEGACGFATHVNTAKDGSGGVTFDLRDLHGAAKTIPRTTKPPPKIVAGGIVVRSPAAESDRTLPVRNALNERIPENWADSGLSGLRSFAIDYSQRSGAPCLLAIVDRITGAKRRTWCWHLARDARDNVKPFKDVRIEGNAFILDHGDAFLKATFVSPADVKIQRKRQDVVLGGGMKGERGFAGFLDRIEATSNGDFFVIVTIQRKDAPEIKVEGAGLDAKVRVGDQLVSFDGQKITIQPSP